MNLKVLFFAGLLIGLLIATGWEWSQISSLSTQLSKSPAIIVLMDWTKNLHSC